VNARRLVAHDALCGVRACPHGCGAHVALASLPHHAAQECAQAMVQCAIPDVRGIGTSAGSGATVDVALRCPFVCRRHELTQHAASCEFRLVACAHCGAAVSARRGAAHAAACPAQPARCPAGCGAVLPRAALQGHLAASCPAQTLACDFKDIGTSVLEVSY
jgi:hypothetical protein